MKEPSQQYRPGANIEEIFWIRNAAIRMDVAYSRLENIVGR
jgi:hypothetical protein